MPVEQIIVTYSDTETTTAILDNIAAITVTYTDVESITVSVDWEA